MITPVVSCSPVQPRWRLIDATPMPSAAALAVALVGRKRRRKPLPLGRAYAAATWWDTPAGRVAGISYQDLPEAESGPGGTLIATMGARFEVLATDAGLHVRRTATDLTRAELVEARAAIDRICRPDTLAAYAAAEARQSPSPKCLACGRLLADQASRARGFGPECWGTLSDAIRGNAVLG